MFLIDKLLLDVIAQYIGFNIFYSVSLKFLLFTLTILMKHFRMIHSRLNFYIYNFLIPQMNKSISINSEVAEQIYIDQFNVKIRINQNNIISFKQFYAAEGENIWQTYFRGTQLKKLIVLCIQNSKLKQLPQMHAPLLQLIQLQQTKIPNLKPFLSRFYPNLTKIMLRWNKIYSLPSIIAPRLCQLDADNNEISQIDQFAKGYYPKLNILKLGCNKLQNRLPWIDSPQLQQLFLEENRLSQTRDQFFKKGCYRKLKQLSMCNNLYEKIPIFIKQGAYQKLQILHLHKNAINNIEMLGIIDLNSLRDLQLSENMISNLKAFHKTQFKNLLSIELSNNLFSQILFLEQCCFQSKHLTINILESYDKLTTDLSKVYKTKNGEVTNFGDWIHTKIWREMYLKKIVQRPWVFEGIRWQTHENQ